MKIYFKKNFIKQYARLQKQGRAQVDKAIKLFEKNPRDPFLRNHALLGRLTGKRSISAGFDLRIVFEVDGDYIVVIMLAVGTHNQVY